MLLNYQSSIPIMFPNSAIKISTLRGRPSQFINGLLIVVTLSLAPSTAVANQEHICLETDHPPQMPIFTIKQTICNYDTSAVKVYAIEVEPKPNLQEDEYSFCLNGQFPEKFLIVRENDVGHVMLNETLDVTELNLGLFLIRRKKGTPSEQRETVNGVLIILTVEDCNRVTWQTICVAILSSACVVLLSSLAIMLILYQQNGLIGKRDNEWNDETLFSAQSRENTFINPRRTSSYEFSSPSKRSGSIVEHQESHGLHPPSQ